MNYKVSVIINAQGANAVASDLGKVDAKLNSVGQTAKNALASFSGNLAADAFQKITGLAIESGKAMLDYAAKMEQTAVGFERLEGGADKAAAQLQKIQKFAADTPFELEGLLPTAQRFEEIGKKGEALFPVLRDIGNLVAGGVGRQGESLDERLDRVGNAIKQVFDKGRVQKEELDQLSEAGVNALDGLAKGLGKTRAETLKLVEAGVVDAETFLKALQKFSQAEFGDAMVKQSKTFNGAFSTITDTIKQESGEAFAPLFEKISSIAVDSAEEIQAQKSDLVGVGVTIAENIVEGVVRGFKDADYEGIVKDFATRFKAEADKNGVWETILKLSGGVGGAAIAGGIEKAFEEIDFNKIIEQNGILTKYDSVTNTFIQLPRYVRQGNYELDQLTNTIKRVDVAAKKVSSLDNALEAEKAKKQTDSLKGVIDDLSSQIAFFGRESEVAATQQKLINDGIYDFDSALAKNAISLAAQLDKLKATQKAQRQYVDNLKELQSFSDGAFDSLFPPQDDLDRFDRWVSRTRDGMSDLKDEVKATRDYLISLAGQRTLEEANRRTAALERSVMNLAKEVGDSVTEFTALESSLLDVARAANLAETNYVTLGRLVGANGGTRASFDITDRIFASDTTTFLEDYKQYNRLLDTTIADIRRMGLPSEAEDAAVSAAMQRAQARIDTLIETYRQALLKLETYDKEGKRIQLFNANSADLDAFILQIINLDAVVSRTTLKQGLSELDRVLEDLNLSIAGFGAKTELQKFDEWLSDAKVTKAIEERAKAIGMQADALKALLRQQKEAQLAGATRPRVVGDPQQSQNPFLEGLFGQNGVEKITSEAEYIKGVYRDLGQTAGDVIATMVQGGASLLEQWIATGEVSGQAIRQMTASIIAGLVAQSAVKTIFELAEGFAATAQHRYSDAAMHFTAAKIYGTVAAVSAAVGIGLGAALGKPNSGGGNAQNQPDYYTSAPANSSTYLQSSNRNFGVSGNSQQSGNKEIVAEIRALNEKLESVHPDHILKISAKRNKGFVTGIVVEGLRENGTAATQMGKALRLG